MGNAPVEPEGAAYGVPRNSQAMLDQPINMDNRRKPSNYNVTPLSQSGSVGSNGSFHREFNGSEKDSQTVASHGQNRKSSMMSVQSHSQSVVSKSRNGSMYNAPMPNQAQVYDDYNDYDDGLTNDEDEDLNLVEVIQQLIPYYGQGNSSNDSNLRAALSGLTTEDIDSKDPYGNTLLILACCYRCEDLVRIMLNKGADPNAVNNSGSSCLHFACHKDSSSLVIAKSLLSHGSNPDVHEMQYGCTPLHYCATAGSLEFCKLLISKGAQAYAKDYYNMTCVDYAKESGSVDVVGYLNQRMAGNSSAGNNRGGRQSGLNNANRGGGGRGHKDWNMYFDPASGCNYYVHVSTGEAVWENDFASRLEAMRLGNNKDGSKDDSVRGNHNDDNKHNHDKEPLSPVKPSSSAPPMGVAGDVKKGKEEAIKKCMITFLEKHDPSEVSNVDDLLSKHKGTEQVLLKDLCKKYNADEKEELDKFKAILLTINPNAMMDRQPSLIFTPNARNALASNSSSQGSPRLDPMQLQNALAEERIKFEILLADERHKYDTQISEERSKYTNLISEKDAKISSLESQGHSAIREKTAFDDEITNLKSALARAQMQGGEAMMEREKEIQRLVSEIDTLKDKLSRADEELILKTNKMTSLENTLDVLSAGNEDRIQKDREAQEEREKVQRELVAKHQAEIKTIEDAKRAGEAKARSDLATAASNLQKQESEAKEAYEEIKKAKQLEIDAIQSKFAEERSDLTRKLSAITMELENSKKETAQAIERMKAAEESQASMRDEIVEAKATIQMNIQLHKDLAREQLARKKLHNEMEDMKGKIRVYIRIRPMSKKEVERGCLEAVTKDGKLSTLVKGIGGKPEEKKTFDFDQVFGGQEGNTQTDVFKDTKHLIMSVLDGYNVCIFAYGQTGAGKSFTMIGGTDIGSCLSEGGDFDPSSGITPRAVVELFRLLNERNAQITYTVEVQMFQLYRDGIDDLLAEKKGKNDSTPPLKITLAEFSDTGLVQVQGAVIQIATTPQEVMKIFAKGSSRRTTASTQMNMESSRSHLICSLVVKMENRRTKVMNLGKLTLVDLAGSERIDKSGAEGDMLKEAQSINKSLSALGDVIAALTSGGNHVPYRNHPLTMLMSDTLGGNAKTLIFINTSPADYNVSETVSSLNFGTRCKDITNSVSAGPGVQLAQVNALKKELNKIKKGGGGGKGPPGS